VNTIKLPIVVFRKMFDQIDRVNITFIQILLG